MTPEMIDEQILAALVARAADLRTANGYHFDAGQHLYQGRVFDLVNDPVPALIITQPDFDADVVTEDDDPSRLQMASEFVIEAYASVDAGDPLPDLMKLRADLVRCFYRPSSHARPGMPKGSDTLDTLGIEGVDVRLISTAKVMPDSGSTTAMAQLTLRVEYIQPIPGE